MGALALLQPLVAPQTFWRAVFVVTAVFYVPVTSAGVRRLRDAGEPVSLILDPPKPALCIRLLHWAAILGFHGLYAIWPVSGTVALGLAFLTDLDAYIYWLSLLFATIATLILLSNTMGKLLLPSYPGVSGSGANTRKEQA